MSYVAPRGVFYPAAPIGVPLEALRRKSAITIEPTSTGYGQLPCIRSSQVLSMQYGAFVCLPLASPVRTIQQSWWQVPLRIRKPRLAEGLSSHLRRAGLDSASEDALHRGGRAQPRRTLAGQKRIGVRGSWKHRPFSSLCQLRAESGPPRRQIEISGNELTTNRVSPCPAQSLRLSFQLGYERKLMKGSGQRPPAFLNPAQRQLSLATEDLHGRRFA